MQESRQLIRVYIHVIFFVSVCYCIEHGSISACEHFLVKDVLHLVIELVVQYEPQHLMLK